MNSPPKKPMSFEDLLAQPPRGKKSVLQPFEAQIREARSRNLTYEQITNWLRQNGVKITHQSLRTWFLSRENLPSPVGKSPVAETAISNRVIAESSVPVESVDSGSRRRIALAPIPTPAGYQGPASDASAADCKNSERESGLKKAIENTARAEVGSNIDEY